MYDPRVFDAFSRLATQQPALPRQSINALDFQRAPAALGAWPQPAMPMMPMMPGAAPMYPGVFPAGMPAFAPQAGAQPPPGGNALGAMRPSTLRTFTLAELLNAGNDNTKGGFRGGVRSVQAPDRLFFPWQIDSGSGAQGPGSIPVEPLPENDNQPPRWWNPFR